MLVQSLKVECFFTKRHGDDQAKEECSVIPFLQHVDLRSEFNKLSITNIYIMFPPRGYEMVI